MLPVIVFWINEQQKAVKIIFLLGGTKDLRIECRAETQEGQVVSATCSGWDGGGLYSALYTSESIWILLEKMDIFKRSPYLLHPLELR